MCLNYDRVLDPVSGGGTEQCNCTHCSKHCLHHRHFHPGPPRRDPATPLWSYLVQFPTRQSRWSYFHPCGQKLPGTRGSSTETTPSHRKILTTAWTISPTHTPECRKVTQESGQTYHREGATGSSLMSGNPTHGRLYLYRLPRAYHHPL